MAGSTYDVMDNINKVYLSETSKDSAEPKTLEDGPTKMVMLRITFLETKMNCVRQRHKRPDSSPSASFHL
jgi:hypothetical protein